MNSQWQQQKQSSSSCLLTYMAGENRAPTVGANRLTGQLHVMSSVHLAPQRWSFTPHFFLCFAAALAPSNHRECLNTTHCGDPNLYCDLTAATDNYVCYGDTSLGGAVDIVPSVVGTCKNTPCRQCQLCLNDFADHVKAVTDTTSPLLIASNADPFLVADKLSAYCNAKVNANRTRTNCEAAVNATKLNVNAGRRAGVICKDLGECLPANVTSCSLATTPTVPEGRLDLCTPHGTNGTSSTVTLMLVPGVSQQQNFTATPPAIPGSPQLCTLNWHCNSTAGFECVGHGVSSGPKIVTCNAGQDTVEYMGTCQPTPCLKCQTCFKTMSAVALARKDEVNPATVAASFKDACDKDAKLKLDPVLCSTVALQVERSFQGNLAKRPAAVCRALNLCNATAIGGSCNINFTTTEVALTPANVDACTIDGIAYGQGGRMLESSSGPGVTYAADNGECNMLGRHRDGPTVAMHVACVRWHL